MPVSHIHLSQRAKDQLVKLKRDTGIMQWNVLCRWAFCTSLAEPSIPPNADYPADSNVELDWKTFGGEYAELYWGLLKERVRDDGFGLGEDVLARFFRLHLHRGIAYISSPGSIDSVRQLFPDIRKGS